MLEISSSYKSTTKKTWWHYTSNDTIRIGGTGEIAKHSNMKC